MAIRRTDLDGDLIGSSARTALAGTPARRSVTPDAEGCSSRYQARTLPPRRSRVRKWLPNVLRTRVKAKVKPAAKKALAKKAARKGGAKAASSTTVNRCTPAAMKSDTTAGTCPLTRRSAKLVAPRTPRSGSHPRAKDARRRAVLHETFFPFLQPTRLYRVAPPSPSQ